MTRRRRYMRPRDGFDNKNSTSTISLSMLRNGSAYRLTASVVGCWLLVSRPCRHVDCPANNQRLTTNNATSCGPYYEAVAPATAAVFAGTTQPDWTQSCAAA